MFRRAFPMLAATILVACGGGSDPEAAAPAAADAPPATSAPVVPATAPAEPAQPAADGNAAVVPAALQFSAPLVGGGEIELGALAGRPILLWFWAPW